MELVLTFGLVSVILGTASGAQNLGVIGAFGVGGYIALAGLWGSPISGASMNPARTFGPDLVGADFTRLLGVRRRAARRRRRRGRRRVRPAGPRRRPGRLRRRPGRDVHRSRRSRTRPEQPRTGGRRRPVADAPTARGEGRTPVERKDEASFEPFAQHAGGHRGERDGDAKPSSEALAGSLRGAGRSDRRSLGGTGG